MTEHELIQGCQANRQDCQKLLFERYAGKMMAVCNRYTNDKQQAQDFLQEGFIKAFKYIGQFRFEGSFEGWLRRIFSSVAIRELSKNKIRFGDIDSGMIQEPFVEPSVVSKMSEDEIQALIRSLPDGYRTVFNLNVIEGYSHDEIAEKLGIKPSTSRVQLMKAKKYLQALIIKIKKQPKAWATFLTL